MKLITALLALFISPSISQATQSLPENAVILDVRTADEYSQGHVPGALNIDFLSSDFKEKVAKLDATKPYKIYCRSGNRSGQALKIMKAMGFKDLENFGSLGQALKKSQRSSK